jgi:hypothetical protein
MKQERDMKRLGYVGNIHHRGKNTDDNEEYNRTYASEGALSEKYGKTMPQKSFIISLWVIGFVATIVVFTSSKTGRENMKRMLTGINFIII